MAEPIGTISAVIGAALLAYQLKKDANEKKESPAASGGAATPQAPQMIPVFLPQPQVGPSDQGGSQPTLDVPFDIMPADLLNHFAQAGRAHDAAPVINIYHGTTPPPTPDTDATTPADPAATTQNAPTQSWTTPEEPWEHHQPDPPKKEKKPAQPTPKPEPYQDFLGRTREGPMPPVEQLKPLATNIGGIVLEAFGTAEASRIAAATGAKKLSDLGKFVKTGGAVPAVAAGVGLGLQVTSALQEYGVYDTVKERGARDSAAIGEKGSKAIATAALPLTVPGAVAKALVTPGESVLGNIHTAAQKSFIPEALAGAKTAASNLAAVASKAGKITEGLPRMAPLIPAKLAATVAPALTQAAKSAAGDMGHKINQTATSAKATVGDLGQKFNQGAASVGGLFSHRWF